MNSMALLQEEIAVHNANVRRVITHEDLTETTANTAQVIELMTKGAGKSVELVKSQVITPFQDASDAAFNTTPLTVGDAGDADRLLTSQEVNVNGTEVLVKKGTGTVYEPSSDTAINLTVGSMSGKSLSNIDTGEVHLYFNILG